MPPLLTETQTQTETVKNESSPNVTKVKSEKSTDTSAEKQGTSLRVRLLELVCVCIILYGIGSVFVNYFTINLEVVTFGNETAEMYMLAPVEDEIPDVRLYEVPCYDRGYRVEREVFKSPPTTCGVLTTDALLPEEMIDQLKALAVKSIKALGEKGKKNRESLNLHWMNLDQLYRKGQALGVVNDDEIELLREAGERVRQVVAYTFGVNEENLLYNKIAQFTRYKKKEEYLEFRHIDKVRSPGLIVTSIIWLGTTDKDFTGGRLKFLNGDKNYNPVVLEPKYGRFAAWTAGWENPHEVEEVYTGERYALIISFTVSPHIGFDSLDGLWDNSKDGLKCYKPDR